VVKVRRPVGCQSEAESVDFAAFAFGRPARSLWTPPDENGFAGPRFFEFFGWCQIIGELRYERCADSGRRDIADFEGTDPVGGAEAHADGDLFPGPHGMRGFCGTSVYLDAAGFDCLCGKGTRFEGAHGPEPLIESGGESHGEAVTGLGQDAFDQFAFHIR
jgi:hypothetical protein